MSTQQEGSGWKWILGGVALLTSYQVGYNHGQPDEPPPPIIARAETPPPISVTPRVTEDALVDADASAESEAVEAPTHFESGLNQDEANYFDRFDTEAAPPTVGRASPQSMSAVYGEGDADDNGSSVAYATPAEDVSSPYATTVSPPASTYAAPTPSTSYAGRSSYTPRPVAVGCAENGSCYGDYSATTGRPKTVGVQGYYRKDGTYVRGHYRSK